MSNPIREAAKLAKLVGFASFDKINLWDE
jgi:hypothetical protein